MTDLPLSSGEHRLRQLHDLGHWSEATSLLLAMWGPEIFRFLLSRLRDNTLADDAFSEFTHDVWRGFNGFQWRSSARVWAYTLARHAMLRCSSRARRRRLRELPLPDHAVLDRLPERPRTETSPALRTGSRERLADLCQQLSAADRQLLSLRLSEQLDWREIARAMNTNSELPSDQLDREAARLRKRFQLVKNRLRSSFEGESARDERIGDFL